MRTVSSSPGRCLAVVLGAILLVGYWSWLPAAITGADTTFLLVIGLNALVFWGATRPLWRGTRSRARQDVYRGLVLVPCLLFHLLTPPAALLFVLARLLD